jgi:hypothetical protein
MQRKTAHKRRRAPYGLLGLVVLFLRVAQDLHGLLSLARELGQQSLALDDVGQLVFVHRTCLLIVCRELLPPTLRRRIFKKDPPTQYTKPIIII